MAEWALVASETLWHGAIAAVPVAGIVWLAARWLPCQPATKHTLWLMALLWLLAAPLMPVSPRLAPHADADQRLANVASFDTDQVTAVDSDVADTGPSDTDESHATEAAEDRLFEVQVLRPVVVDAAPAVEFSKKYDVVVPGPVAMPRHGNVELAPDVNTSVEHERKSPPRMVARTEPVTLESLAQAAGSVGLPTISVRGDGDVGLAAQMDGGASGMGATEAQVNAALEHTGPALALGVPIVAREVDGALGTHPTEVQVVGASGTHPTSASDDGALGTHPTAVQVIGAAGAHPADALVIGASGTHATDTSDDGASATHPEDASDGGALRTQPTAGLVRRLSGAAAGWIFSLMADVRPWAVGLLAIRDAVGQLPAIPVTLWVCGAVLLVGLKFLGILRFRTRVRGGDPAPAAVTAMVREIAGQMGLRRLPEVYMVTARVSPMIWCGRRVRLILPAALWTELDDDARRAVVCHELAHVRRRDHWVVWAEMIIAGLYWWHPLVWWIRTRLRAEAEHCCDAWVTWLLPEGRRAYAEALLRTREFMNSDQPLPAVGMAITTGRAGRLARRITMVMTQRVRPRLSASGVVLAVALAAAGWMATPARSCPKTEGVAVAGGSAHKCCEGKPCTHQKCGAYGVGKEAAEAKAAAEAAFAADSTFKQYMVDRARAEAMLAGDGSQGGGSREAELAERLAQLEAELERLGEQLEGLGEALHGDDDDDGPRVRQPRAPRAPRGPRAPRMRNFDGGAAGVFGVETPAPPMLPRHPMPPSASATPIAPRGMGGHMAPPVATFRPGEPQPSWSDGGVVVRSYQIPAGKLEALAKLMVRDDVPIRVRALDDRIEVHATERHQAIFKGFVDLINSTKQSKTYRMSPGKLKALSELMVRSDVPIMVRPMDDGIRVDGTNLEQSVFRAFINMIDARPGGSVEEDDDDGDDHQGVIKQKEHKERARAEGRARDEMKKAARHREEAMDRARRAMERLERQRAEAEASGAATDLAGVMAQMSSLVGEEQAQALQERLAELTTNDYMQAMVSAAARMAIEANAGGVAQQKELLETRAQDFEREARELAEQVRAMEHQADQMREEAEKIQEDAEVIQEKADKIQEKLIEEPPAQDDDAPRAEWQVEIETLVALAAEAALARETIEIEASQIEVEAANLDEQVSALDEAAETVREAAEMLVAPESTED